MRKIIQISESLTAADICGVCWHISALCDDGTIWAFDNAGKKWEKLPDIPQDDEQGKGHDESV